MLRFPVVIVSGVVACLLSASAIASVLHFDSEVAPGTLFGSYGDRVATSPDAFGHTYGVGNAWTPNIEMEYHMLDPSTRLAVPGTAPGVWGGGYGDLDHVAWAGSGPVAMLELEFLPHPGYAVIVNAFDAAGFVVDQPNQPIYFADADNVIVADLSSLIHGQATHDHFEPALMHYGPLRLQIGNNWNVGVDHIDFDQVLVLPGDINHDCVVDLIDLATLLVNFGADNPTAFDGDFNVDGEVDLTDLSVLLSAFGTGC